MYETFFNLSSMPFELVPDPEFLYLSRSHKKALMHLDYGIKEKKGFILITGEVGSGKTTIVKDILKHLDDKITISKVFNTKVSAEQLIAMINDDFGLEVAGKDKIALLRDLNAFLVDEYAYGRQPVLIIDEAQNLNQDLLEEVRLLSNLETDKSKLLQIILVGQPELRQTLLLPELRQLRQRISVSCHIEHLTREETEEYIYHRLEMAGNRSAICFQNGTLDYIQNYSRGTPRLINIVCDFLMLSAFADEKKELTLDLVKEVIGELDIENRYWKDNAASLAEIPPDDVLQELKSRMDRLEYATAGKFAFGADDEEIAERISALEQRSSHSSCPAETELARLSGTLEILSLEIATVKEKAMLLEKKIREISGKKEKGLWSWMFS
jgi:general secretion pathway protein A